MAFWNSGYFGDAHLRFSGWYVCEVICILLISWTWGKIILEKIAVMDYIGWWVYILIGLLLARLYDNKIYSIANSLELL